LKIAILVEWDNAKDESRYKKYGEVTGEMMKQGPVATVKKLVEEGVAKGGAWADNTGHIINLFEFENMEAFGKVWTDSEWHMRYLQINPLVDNMRVRVLRPSIPVPED
jgi:hypothetical protein